MKISRARKKQFLQVLEATGSLYAAARAASSHCGGRRPGYDAFLALRKRDPKFAEQVSRALNNALGRAEESLVARAIDGWSEPVFHKGSECGEVRRFDSKLLLRLLEKLDPSSWSPRERRELSGKLGVQHSRPGSLHIEPGDVLRLDHADQEKLISLIEEIGRKKAGDGRAD